MSKSPSIEAARKYICECFGVREKQIRLLSKTQRLWIVKYSHLKVSFDSFYFNENEEFMHKYKIYHICNPRKILHIMDSSSKYQQILKKVQGSNYYRYNMHVGELVDGSFWHTDTVSYRCSNCKEVFKDKEALFIRLFEEKEKGFGL